MYYHPFAGIRCKTQTSTTKKGIKHVSESSEELKRIANALEEILRLVKLDQEATKKRWEYKPDEKN